MLNRSRTGQPALQRRARGVTLIETMMSILVFSIGLLGMAKMQSQSVVVSRDAMYRAEASMRAHEIIGVIWTDRANVDSYQHRPGGTVCEPSGSASSQVNVTNWLAEFTTAGAAAQLPGATTDLQQIVVTTSGSTKIVRVHLCWQSPQDGTPRSFVAVSQL
jgi:type IV pilus assembly protein PilV